MIVSINDEFRISTDAYNYNLERLVQPGEKAKVQEPRWVAVAHCSSFHHAIDKACDIGLKEAIDSNDAVNRILQLIEDVRQTIRNYSKYFVFAEDINDNDDAPEGEDAE